MNHFENMIPDKVYELAEEICLSDLLASPATRHWAISALSNICSLEMDNPKKFDEDDRQMLFVLQNVNNQLSGPMRMEAFDKVKQAVARSREARQTHE